MPPSPAATSRTERARPAERYGDRPSRPRRRVPLVAVVAGLLVAAGLGWVSWGMLQPSAEGEVGVFTAVDDGHVELVLEVTRPVGSTAVCTLEAVGSGFGQVGILDVTVPPADTQVSRVHLTMATTETASIAMVKRCDLL
ncbi:DUF4307 domain-containing protein [Pseudactinotalea suaedae]|uniref:DUF4307 domain-containing protein n=1 Tax=Pseudactinotalea suaedae TaxID=1524924 RepID=UPI0012E1B939|nr:DUF4307 domain-containing protein [Pseudactinotalea suaedae]